MPNKMNSRKVARQGLTLIELIVVLTILIALGGIAVAVVPGMLGRAHTSSDASSIPTIDATIKQNLLTEGGIGDRFDSMVEDDGTLVPGLGAAVAAGTINADELTALAALGVTELVLPDATVDNITFEAHAPGTGVPTALADGSDIVVLTAAAALEAEALFNIPAGDFDRYLLLGIGEQCTLVGAEGAFAEAPVHFAEDATGRPEVAYSRFMLVVGLNADGEAEYLGAAALHDDGIGRASGALSEWYEGGHED